jgi:hypothetical protein
MACLHPVLRIWIRIQTRASHSEILIQHVLLTNSTTNHSRIFHLLSRAMVYPLWYRREMMMERLLICGEEYRVRNTNTKKSNVSREQIKS